MKRTNIFMAGAAVIAALVAAAAPSSARTQEFYNVFLSWWERAKTDVGSL